jgi:hypothetical protein
MDAVDEPSGNEEAGDGLGGLVRRVLSPGPAPEERLEELVAARRRELDETAARFDASVADLERREELLRDSRASVERMLRLGKRELEARESDLDNALREVADREARLAEAEADVARRRQEVGAVELRRAALERREQDLDAREQELLAREKELEARLSRSEEEPHAHAISPVSDAVTLAFVPGTRYTLVRIDAPSVERGSPIEVDGEKYVVARVGRSPLPRDGRRCAYLTRGTLPRPSRGSS